MRTLHHVALGALDVALLAEFYGQAFGLEFDRDHRTANGTLRSIWLRMGPLLLMIEHTDDPLRKVENVGAGPFLLAFSVEPTERDEVEARLQELGAPIESRTSYTSYARDPEGNRIAISHFPTKREPPPTPSPRSPTPISTMSYRRPSVPSPPVRGAPELEDYGTMYASREKHTTRVLARNMRPPARKL